MPTESDPDDYGRLRALCEPSLIDSLVELVRLRAQCASVEEKLNDALVELEAARQHLSRKTAECDTLNEGLWELKEECRKAGAEHLEREVEKLLGVRQP